MPTHTHIYIYIYLYTHTYIYIYEKMRILFATKKIWTSENKKLIYNSLTRLTFVDGNNGGAEITGDKLSCIRQRKWGIHIR